MKTNKQLCSAIGYLRMSEGQESVERQRLEIEGLARRGGYEVVRWLEDQGPDYLIRDNGSVHFKLLLRKEGAVLFLCQGFEIDGDDVQGLTAIRDLAQAALDRKHGVGEVD